MSVFDERSAGGLVFRINEGRVFWLVIKFLSKKTLKNSGETAHITVYKFPKGHVQDLEVLKQTALREVEEEGRIKSRIISKIGSNDYILWDKETHKKIIKKVTFFLMEYEGESDSRYTDHEVVLDREWFSFDHALEKLAYESERKLLRIAAFRLDALLKSQ
ncbi:MAG: NUDIX domain-containing protein [Candidatus Shapirobacteria bacterium]